MAKLEAEKEKAEFQLYVADSLYCIMNNRVMNERFVEVMQRRRTPVDDRPAEEIAEDILSRAGIKIVKNESV